MSHDSAISKSLAVGLLLFMFVQIILYGLLTQYAPPQNQLQDYIFFPDIHVMIFVGFGFLMSFLHKAGFTATSHAFFVAAYTVLWAILNRAFWKRAVLSSQQWSVQVDIGVTDLTNADFVAGAVLISFGALLGRVSIGQLTIMAIIEVVFYAMNEASIVYGLQISDAGGTYYIHMFGAYFGLVTSFVLHRMNKDLPPPNTEAEGSTRLTDTLAMVGTLFLYIYWPSFNAAGFANTNSHSRAIVNTFLSITMSTVTSFLVSVIVDKNGKINMVEVQNSTLAGGVAMGAAAGLVINPVGALITGFFAGTISVLGFRFITPALNSVVPDTCGVHNLHGMPSLLGAIVSAIAVGAARRGSYQGTYGDAVVDTNHAYDRNAGYQIVAIFVTLGFALFGGLFTGFILGLSHQLPTFYDDKVEYNIPGEAPHAEEDPVAAIAEKEMEHREPIQADSH